MRIPVASLSGGQRQTVAIARSLLGEPKVVMLDEPTAALGVAQTAEVLNLVERLRENGLGVILISHNMADVMAVADRVAVLRLGRNNGDFNVSRDQRRGDHRRHHRRHDQRRVRARPRREHAARSSSEHHDPEPTPRRIGPGRPDRPASRRRPAGRAADRAAQGVGGCVRVFLSRLRSGDLGSLPVVIGLDHHLGRLPEPRTARSSPAATWST